MYKAVYFDRFRNMAHLWDDEQGYLCKPWRNYAFVENPMGKYKTLHGKKVEKIYNFQYDSEAYEADLPPETKILIENYRDSDDPAKNIKVLIVDIETDSSGGFPNMEEYDKEITAFSYYEKLTDQYKCLILDREGKVKNYIKDNIEVISFDTEESLLNGVLNVFEQIRPDIITGWNISFNGDNKGFDIPYIYGRICKILGQDEASRLSEIGKIYTKKRDGSVVIGGTNLIDYLLLYKKFRFEPRETYRLDFIGMLEVGKGKTKYDGSLNQLYKEDINKFIEYNLADVEIVKLLDDKFKFLDLAVNVTTTGHVPYEWFHMSSRFIEGAIITHMRRNGNMVAPNKPIKTPDEAIEKILDNRDEHGIKNGFVGAYVKNPIPGLYSWVASADINSLYPSTIRTLNISTETYMGKISNWDSEKFMKGELEEVKIGNESYNIENFRKLINDDKIRISAIGAMYNGKKQGIIPSILELWFSQRVEFQEMSSKYGKEGNKELEAYYSRRQHVQKIFLNSVYGILGLPSSRFYLKDNAESTTLTGQTIIKLSEKMVIEYFKSIYTKYGKSLEDISNVVIYIDTDSIYFSVDELGNIEGIKEEEKKEYTKKVCLEIVDRINQFYPILVRKLFNADTNKIKIAADTINETALWKKKKAYALNKVYDMGKGKDVHKTEVKGIAVVRSDFPIKFKEFMKNFLNDILHRKGVENINKSIIDLIENIDSHSVRELAKNTSVTFYSEKKNINYAEYLSEDRSEKNTRQPFTVGDGATAQCKASLMYNDLLVKFKLDKKIEPIYTGQKIKYVYLKENPYNIDALAFKGDGTDPKEIMDIIETHVDKMKMYSSVLENKIEDFYSILKWKVPNVDTIEASKFFDF